MLLKVMAWSDLKYQLCMRTEQDTTSESSDIKNNGIKEGLFVYPNLPEYTVSLTSLLGLILVTELTRGGAA